MLSSDQLVIVLLGGLGGALAAQAIQIYRDRAQHLRGVRGAARLVRTEITTNRALAQIVILKRMVPSRPKWPEPSNERLGHALEMLVSELSRDEVVSLLAMDSLHVEFVRVITAARETPATAEDIKWLSETWWRETYICDAMLDFRGARWWEPILHPRAFTQFKRAEIESRWASEDFAKLLAKVTTRGPG